MKTEKTYYVIIHDAIFDESQDQDIADRIAQLYRKIGWTDVRVSTEEPI